MSRARRPVFVAMAAATAVYFAGSQAPAISKMQAHTPCRQLQPLAVQHARLLDARRLIEEGRKLQSAAQSLERQLESSIASSDAPVLVSVDNLREERARVGSQVAASSEPFNLEVEQRSHPVRMSAAEYQSLLAQYKEALNRYMRHRQQVQQHAVQYHDTVQQPISTAPQGQQQPQQAAEAAVSMALSRYKPIQWQVADACQALQASEAELHGVELQLFGAVQNLMKMRGKVPAAMIEQQVSSLQSVAASHQRNCMTFDESVMTKHNQVSGRLHDLAHRAMLDGDQSELQSAYSSGQSTTTLLDHEMKQADLHSKLANYFIDQLNQLGAAPSAPSQPAPQPQSEDEDPIPLDQEFAEVQELYRQIQQARPQSK